MLELIKLTQEKKTQMATALLNAYLDEIAGQGIGPDRTILLGFSQGTMMALQVAFRRAAPFAQATTHANAAACRMRDACAKRSAHVASSGVICVAVWRAERRFGSGCALKLVATAFADHTSEPFQDYHGERAI